jgi:hypothetical protein
MAIQAKDIMGRWNVKALFVADTAIGIATECEYAFEFGGAFQYTMYDNTVKIDLKEIGAWAFDEGNAQMTIQFRELDGSDSPNRRFVCVVSAADARTLKFNYTDVNGIVSRVELTKADP